VSPSQTLSQNPFDKYARRIAPCSRLLIGASNHAQEKIPMQHEPILSSFNIEHFGGAPPDDGEDYTAEDTFTGFAMRVGELIVEAATCDRHHEAITLAALLAASSPEKGISGGRWVARMWEAHCARRGS
jgi:hypothetical protein